MAETEMYTISLLRKEYLGKWIKHKRTELRFIVEKIEYSESAVKENTFAMMACLRNGIGKIEINACLLPVNWKVIG